VRLANLDGRLALVLVTEGVDGEGEERAVDVERASDGLFSSDPQAVYSRWEEFREWVSNARIDPLVIGGELVDRLLLGPPVPRPPQVFAIGVNYVEHAEEAGYPSDSLPVTFTKFPSCLTGPEATVVLPSAFVDWEVELVVVIGKRGENVARENAFDHVAGFTVGQDLSERHVQAEGTKPQFSLGKSYRGFGPTGPWVVTLDELTNPTDLEIGCRVADEQLQQSRTSRLIYDIPELIVRLSGICVLQPGDIIFSGTPAGVGNARTPKRFLTTEDVLVSSIEGVGSITTRFESPSA
jgi:2-keto-4-pentenoate hydratase/2-oxohepta-3-ene-1,7-dioic acid hydratase in catechol pathway